jgi:hypothetical protein
LFNDDVVVVVQLSSGKQRLRRCGAPLVRG